MSNPLNRILHAKAIVKILIGEIINDENQPIANRVAAAMFGESSGNRKKKLINNLLVETGFISKDDYLHVKNGSGVASQISVKDLDKDHYVASIIDGTFILLKFDPYQAHDDGYACHGSRVQSDSRRANVEKNGEVIWAERIDYSEFQSDVVPVEVETWWCQSDEAKYGPYFSKVEADAKGVELGLPETVMQTATASMA
jgi:hypothetical protein